MDAVDRTGRTLCIVVAFLCLCLSPLFAEQAEVSARQVARAPEDSSPIVGGWLSAIPSVDYISWIAPLAETHPREQQSGKLLEIALLQDPTPPSGSAADLVEIAHEYGWNWDSLRKKLYLRQAAEAYPGTRDAALALLELARTLAERGELTEATAIFAEVNDSYRDHEIANFTAVMAQLCEALLAKDWEAAEDLLTDTAHQWKGSELGAWAALQLGNLQRDYTLDFDRAINYYEAAIEAYPKTLVAQEAQLSIAEAVAWQLDRYDEAVDLFQLALLDLTNPRLIARATIGQAFPLNMMGEYTEAFDLLSEFIEAYPKHPGIPLARAYRSYAAGKLGWWELAVLDAETFLKAPIGQHGHPWTHHCEDILGQDAYRRGDYQAASQHFQRAIDAAPDLDGQALTRAGMAHCYAATGNMKGALQAFHEAAQTTTYSEARCMFLHQAALVAEQAGAVAEFNEVVGLMVHEFPGSHLTTQLVGQEILPAPEI